MSCRRCNIERSGLTIKTLPEHTCCIGLTTKVAQFGWGVIESLFLRVPKKTLEKRLEICSRCDQRTQGPLGDLCGSCGCLLNIKAAGKGQKCPKGLWGGGSCKSC